MLESYGLLVLGEKLTPNYIEHVLHNKVLTLTVDNRESLKLLNYGKYRLMSNYKIVLDLQVPFYYNDIMHSRTQVLELKGIDKLPSKVHMNNTTIPNLKTLVLHNANDNIVLRMNGVKVIHKFEECSNLNYFNNNEIKNLQIINQPTIPSMRHTKLHSIEIRSVYSYKNEEWSNLFEKQDELHTVAINFRHLKDIINLVPKSVDTFIIRVEVDDINNSSLTSIINSLRSMNKMIVVYTYTSYNKDIISNLVSKYQRLRSMYDVDNNHTKHYGSQLELVLNRKVRDIRVNIATKYLSMYYDIYNNLSYLLVAPIGIDKYKIVDDDNRIASHVILLNNNYGYTTTNTSIFPNANRIDIYENGVYIINHRMDVFVYTEDVQLYINVDGVSITHSGGILINVCRLINRLYLYSNTNYANKHITLYSNNVVEVDELISNDNHFIIRDKLTVRKYIKI